MPYIEITRRSRVRPISGKAETAGELNFQITEIIRAYMIDHGRSYQTFNDILGALEGAGKEFYRRVVVPYEDEKIKLNGDVY